MSTRGEGIWATVAAVLVWLVDNAQAVTQAVISFLTLAWWIRIWWLTMMRKKVRRRPSGFMR